MTRSRQCHLEKRGKWIVKQWKRQIGIHMGRGTSAVLISPLQPPCQALKVKDVPARCVEDVAGRDQ